jgi:hypothetical protein
MSQTLCPPMQAFLPILVHVQVNARHDGRTRHIRADFYWRLHIIGSSMHLRALEIASDELSEYHFLVTGTCHIVTSCRVLRKTVPYIGGVCSHKKDNVTWHGPLYLDNARLPYLIKDILQEGLMFHADIPVFICMCTPQQGNIQAGRCLVPQVVFAPNLQYHIRHTS